MQRYPVDLDGKQVGSVEVERIGLYYHIQCTCQMRQGLHRLYASTDRGDRLMGVCCPEGDGLSVRKRIPVKELGEKFRFFLCPEGRKGFIPICEDKPLRSLVQLPFARFCFRNGQPGLVFESDGSVGE